MNDRPRHIALHIIGCISFLSIPILFAPGPSLSWHMFAIAPTQRELLSNMLMIGFFYLSTYYLIPRYYFIHEYVSFFVCVFFCYAVITLVPHYVIHNRPQPSWDHGPEFRQPMPRGVSFVFEVGHNFLRFLVVFFVSLTMRVSKQWQKTQQEKMNAELSFLKAQINPHFLFNTLNSIYSLALQKSDKTADAVVKLSEMMRYVIQEADKDFVSLDKEIAYIRDYIVLQENRFGKSSNISFAVSGDFKGKKIAPLILITFVENAFKYGINAEDSSSAINISIEVTPQELKLKVSNKKVNVNQSLEKSGGKGIQNTKDRLSMLYRGSYLLDIQEDDVNYNVALNILLT